MPYGPGVRSGQSELTQLLLDSSRGDEAAFERLYRLQGAPLYGIALRITKTPTLAMDALQDAFVQVWRHGSRYNPARGTAETWLRSLVRHRSIDILHRHGRNMPTWEELENERPDPSRDSLERLEDKQNGRHLKLCLDKVDPARRALIILAYADGMSHGEISAHTGQPLGTVKSSIRRVLIALKACLGGTP